MTTICIVYTVLVGHLPMLYVDLFVVRQEQRETDDVTGRIHVLDVRLHTLRNKTNRHSHCE